VFWGFVWGFFGFGLGGAGFFVLVFCFWGFLCWVGGKVVQVYLSRGYEVGVTILGINGDPNHKERKRESQQKGRKEERDGYLRVIKRLDSVNRKTRPIQKTEKGKDVDEGEPLAILNRKTNLGQMNKKRFNTAYSTTTTEYMG